MSINLAQKAAYIGGPSQNSSMTLNFPNAMTPGSILLCMVFFTNPPTYSITNVSDANGNWTPLTQYNSTAGSAIGVQIWWKANSSSGVSNTVTVTGSWPNGSGNAGFFIAEWTGVSKVNASGGGAAPSSTNAWTCPPSSNLSITPGDLVVAVWGDFTGTGASTQVDGWTLQASNTTWVGAWVSQVINGSSAQAEVTGPATNADWSGAIVSLSPPSIMISETVSSYGSEDFTHFGNVIGGG